MDDTDIERIELAQDCLHRARAESNEADIATHAGELMHHLDMMLRTVTSIQLMSGELDDAELVLTPRARALARPPDAR